MTYAAYLPATSNLERDVICTRGAICKRMLCFSLSPRPTGKGAIESPLPFQYHSELKFYTLCANLNFVPMIDSFILVFLCYFIFHFHRLDLR